MHPRSITDAECADLIDASTIINRIDLGSTMTTIGLHPDLHAWTVTQNPTGFWLVSGRHSARDFEGMDADDIAEAFGVLGALARSVSHTAPATIH